MHVRLAIAVLAATASCARSSVQLATPADLALRVGLANAAVVSAGEKNEFKFEILNTSNETHVICASPVSQRFRIGYVFDQSLTVTHRPCLGRTKLAPGQTASWNEEFTLPGCDRDAISKLPLLAKRSLCSGEYQLEVDMSFFVGPGCPGFKNCGAISLTSSPSILRVP